MGERGKGRVGDIKSEKGKKKKTRQKLTYRKSETKEHKDGTWSS